MSATDTKLQKKPVLGIGSCLAGNAVRYDGQTKSPNKYVRALGDNFELRAFCPEMAAGMGVPRPPIQLVGDESQVRALDVETHCNDFTSKLAGHVDTVLSQAPELCGYILVKGSPSCGYDRVKRFTMNGHNIASDQQGIFAAGLATADPLLPLEDDERLTDPGLHESFVTRAYTYHDWKQLLAGGVSAQKLLAFYSRYKYLVMAHHPASYKKLGPMLANAGKVDLQALAGDFISTLMDALSQRATRRTHSNVLYHLSGYLKRDISSEERQQLKALIDQYRCGITPLAVPLARLTHHFADSPNAYIEQPVYMTPYPHGCGI